MGFPRWPPVRLHPVRRPVWILSLLLLTGCDRQLDPAESGALALGQNLYRAGQLDVSGPEYAFRAAEAQFARWSVTPKGMDVRWIGEGLGALDQGPQGPNPTRIRTARTAAGRILLADFSSAALAFLPSTAGIEQRGDQLHLGAFQAPVDDCCLVLVRLDPDRRGLPLTIVASENEQRLLAVLPHIRPGWKREAFMFRLGRPWLYLDLERGWDEWLLVDGDAYDGRSDSASENQSGLGVESTTPRTQHSFAPGLKGTAGPGVDIPALESYAQDCRGVFERVAELLAPLSASSLISGSGWAPEPKTPWVIQAFADVPLQGWSAELAFVDFPSRTLRVLLPPGIGTDRGRNLALALLRAAHPDKADWLLDAQSAWCARLHETSSLGLLAQHPERPPFNDLISNGPTLRHSPYLLRPLRAELIRWSRDQNQKPEASGSAFEEHLAQLRSTQGIAPEFESRPRGAFLRPAANPGSRQAHLALQGLADAGANTVALAYDLSFNPDPGQGRAWQPARALGSVLGDAHWLVACAHAQALGLEVQLWPTVLASHSSVPTTRLVRVSEPQRRQLFDDLSASATHAALMAAASGARVVSLGYDLGQSLVTQVDENREPPTEWLINARSVQKDGWIRTIRAARASFEGAVVVSTEDVRRFEGTDLWSEVDALAGGLFPIFEGTDQGQIPLWRLKELFVEHLAPVKARADELGLPLWIAPSGFRPTLTAARGPGADGLLGTHTDAAPNSSRQAELLQALGHGARAHEAGLLVWKLTTADRDLLGRGIGGDRGEKVLRAVLAP